MISIKFIIQKKALTMEISKFKSGDILISTVDSKTNKNLLLVIDVSKDYIRIKHLNNLHIFKYLKNSYDLTYHKSFIEDAYRLATDQEIISIL
jgi:hypothetical protein